MLIAFGILLWCCIGAFISGILSHTITINIDNEDGDADAAKILTIFFWPVTIAGCLVYAVYNYGKTAYKSSENVNVRR